MDSPLLDLSHCYLDICRDCSSDEGEIWQSIAWQPVVVVEASASCLRVVCVNEGCGLQSYGQSLMVRSAFPPRGSPHLLDHLPQGLLEQLPSTYPGFSACGIAALPWWAGSLQSFAGDM